MNEHTVRVGTRGSDLALWQAQWVIGCLQRHHPDVEFQLVEVTTQGDRDRQTPLHRAGGIGLFVKSLEFALIDGEIDLAVHSLKDLPSQVPSGLALAAVPQRADPRDALVSATGVSLLNLPAEARVGTGSPRRRAQLLAYRPDLEVAGIRGNVDTRLAKADGRNYDAVVLATAGLIRLGCQEAITEILPPDLMLPAAGQGSLAVEIRAEDVKTSALVAPVNDQQSWAAAKAERRFMSRLGAGCHVPAAAYAVVDAGELWLRGLVASHDGQEILRGDLRGPMDRAEALGLAVAKDLLLRGAEGLLAQGS